MQQAETISVSLRYEGVAFVVPASVSLDCHAVQGARPAQILSGLATFSGIFWPYTVGRSDDIQLQFRVPSANWT